MVKGSNLKYSIIVPIYNVEIYLRECIDSIVNQDIGFKNNIELILVNDGSDDDSGKICEEYLDKYPQNIIYINKENAGVSSARNEGLNVSSGEFVWFIDSDDYIANDALRLLAEFYDKYDADKTLPLVIARMKFFDARNAFHSLDYRFKETRVIDLNQYPFNSCMASANILYRRSAIGDIRFDTSFDLSEDALFLNEVLLQSTKKIGVVREALYYYRKRFEKTSAMDISRDSMFNYQMMSLNVFEKLFSISKNLNKENGLLTNSIDRFIQYLFLYHCSYESNLIDRASSDNAREQVLHKALGLLKQCEDRVIVTTWVFGKHFTLSDKQLLLDIKHDGTEWRKNCVISSKANVKHNGSTIMNLKQEFKVYCIDISEDGDKNIEFILQLMGFNFRDWGINLKFTLKNQVINPEEIKLSKTHDVQLFGKVFSAPLCYKLVVPKNKNGVLRAVLEYNDENGVERAFKFQISHYKAGVNLPVIYPARKYNLPFNDCSYRKVGDKLISVLPNDLGIKIQKYRYGRVIELENIFKNKCLENLPPYNEWNTSDVLDASKIKNKKIRKIRYKNLMKKYLNFGGKTKIWILNDRIISATDNAYFLYKYIKPIARKNNIKLFFALNKDCPDWRRLKKEKFNLVDFGSKKHFWLYLNADIIASTHADYPTRNPFGKKVCLYSSLFEHKFIHLWHGVAHNDHSRWLNKYNFKADLWTLSSSTEMNYILNANYDYSKENVVATGFPRYDSLYNRKKQNIITLFPSWRKNFVTGLNCISIPTYNPDFINSDYYNFYNSLLNDRRILDALVEYNWSIEFIIHPNMVAQISDYVILPEFKNRIRIVTNLDTVNDIIGESKVFVTDYSGTAYDAAYAKNKIIYAHFDFKDITTKDGYHIYGEDSIISYKEDGFGPVFENYEDVVQEILNSIKNNAKIEEIYQKRINSFFDYIDDKNSERVFNVIKKLSDATSH